MVVPGQHAQIAQLGVLAVAFHAALPQVGPLLRGIAAGGHQGYRLPRPQGGALFFAVILVHAIDQPVQHRLHGRGAVPGVDGCGKYQHFTGQHPAEDLLHVVPDGTAKDVPVPLAGAAGPAGPQVQVIEPNCLAPAAQFLQLRREGPEQRGGVPCFSGTAHQDTHLFFHGKRLPTCLICFGTQTTAVPHSSGPRTGPTRPAGSGCP